MLTTPATERIKDRTYESFARVAKAFAHPLRLRVLELLAQGERTVDDVCRNTPLRRKNASAQLQVLLRDGIVARRKVGSLRYYRIADDAVVRGLRELQRLAMTVSAEAASIDRDYFHEPSIGEPASLPSVRSGSGSGEAWVLDVRPAEEYRQGHLPGAISIPITELEERLEEVPTDREILVYCRGPYCIWEVEATRFLRANGRNARRLAATVADWRLTAGSDASAREPSRSTGA